MNPNSSAALRFGQRTQISGAPGLDLESLSTYELPNGCVVLVDSAPLIPDLFVLALGLSAAADGINIIAPVAGPGRWVRYSYLHSDPALTQFPPFTVGPVLPGTTTTSVPLMINRNAAGKILVQVQMDLTDTTADEEIVIQGLLTGVPAGPFAAYKVNVAMPTTPQTVTYMYLATVPAGPSTLSISVAAGLTGTVNVLNANMFVTGQV
jgi:hypothetical protein